MNIWGYCARTIIFDNAVRDYLKSHEEAVIINIACGLDDRFSRVDNGRILWYNIDLPEVIQIRNNIFEKQYRVINIARSVFDFSRIYLNEKGRDVLVITEGVLMYFSEAQVQELYNTIAKNFNNVTLLIELMSKWMVKNQQLHQVTQTTTASFDYAVNEVKDFCNICPQYNYVTEWNITDYMKRYSKIFMTIISPVMKPKNNKIGKFEIVK